MTCLVSDLWKLKMKLGMKTVPAWHVTPIDDLREHELSSGCWCKPTEDPEWPQVYVHHSMDRREEYEENRKLH